MKNIPTKYLNLISGATYGVCTIDDYIPNYVTIDSSPETDPIIIAMKAINAAAWGCAGGAVMGGGIIGCGIGAFIGGGGSLMETAIIDAYKMYIDAKH